MFLQHAYFIPEPFCICHFIWTMHLRGQSWSFQQLLIFKQKMRSGICNTLLLWNRSFSNIFNFFINIRVKILKRIYQVCITTQLHSYHSVGLQAERIFLSFCHIDKIPPNNSFAFPFLTKHHLKSCLYLLHYGRFKLQALAHLFSFSHKYPGEQQQGKRWTELGTCVVDVQNCLTT